MKFKIFYQSKTICIIFQQISAIDVELCLQPRVKKSISANLDRIWAINGDLVFFALRVLDLEFVIFISINQNSVRFVIEKIRQSSYYNVAMKEDILKYNFN